MGTERERNRELNAAERVRNGTETEWERNEALRTEAKREWDANRAEQNGIKRKRIVRGQERDRNRARARQGRVERDGNAKGVGREWDRSGKGTGRERIKRARKVSEWEKSEGELPKMLKVIDMTEKDVPRKQNRGKRKELGEALQ